MSLDESRIILKLRDDELEELIKKWVADNLSEYIDFDRNSGAGDRGLDAVGFLSDQRYEGPWDNFQCKQLSKNLGEPEFFAEIGKLFYYASLGEFTTPNRYIFVAPMGVARGVRKWIGMPSTIKAELLSNWSSRCATKIVANVDLPMTEELEKCINAFNFSNIEAWNANKLIEQPNLRKNLYAHVDIDPGMAPEGVVPSSVGETEKAYISQLVIIYGDNSGTQFNGELDVLAHPEYGPELQDQRRRYHDADAFHRHFRDNVPDKFLSQFDQDIYDGIIEDYRENTGYKRLNAVMKSAGKLQVSGIFEKHKRAPISVKQGVCHHFVNKGRLKWAK